MINTDKLKKKLGSKYLCIGWDVILNAEFYPIGKVLNTTLDSEYTVRELREIFSFVVTEENKEREKYKADPENCLPVLDRDPEDNLAGEWNDENYT